MSAPTMRGARALAVAVLFCLVAALFPAAVSAHDPQPTQESYEVEVTKTRQVPVYEWVDRPVRVDKTRTVPVYKWVDEPIMATRQIPVYVWVPVPRFKTITIQARVAPFTETYTYYPPCELIVILDTAVNYCPPGEPRTRAVYNYRTETRQVPDGVENVRLQNGTKTETYDTGQTRRVRVQTGTKTETYSVTETRRVRVQTGTKTETYKAKETRYRDTCPADHTLNNGTCEHPAPTPTPAPCPTNTFSQPLPQSAAFYIDVEETIRFYSDYELAFGAHPVGIYVILEPIWQALDNNPNCYKAIEPDNWRGLLGAAKEVMVEGKRYAVSGGKTIIGGAEFIVKGGRLVLEVAENHVLSPLETAAKEAADAAIATLAATDRFLKRTLCTATGAGVTTVAAGTVGHFSAKTATVVRIAATVSLATPPGIGTAIGIAIGLAIVAYCTDGFTSNPYSDSDSDSGDSDGKAQSAPAAASGLSLAAGDGEIAVSWSASPTKPADGFGYRVQWKPAAEAWDDAELFYSTGSNLATSYAIGGLVNGSAYDVRVAAYNDGGLSAWITGQTTPAAPKAPAPAAASGLKLVAGDEQIAVSWSASPTKPAAGFGYRVQWKPAAKAWDAAAQSTDLAHGTDLATSHTIGGLSNGSAYDVRVAAYNADSLSDWVTGSAAPAAPKTPAPPWAHSTVAYATLDECTDNAGERWCGYDPQSRLWYVDTRN